VHPAPFVDGKQSQVGKLNNMVEFYLEVAEPFPKEAELFCVYWPETCAAAWQQ
jgi:hypothetical protein